MIKSILAVALFATSVAAPIQVPTAKEGDSGHKYPVKFEAIEKIAPKKAPPKSAEAPRDGAAAKDAAAKKKEPVPMHLFGLAIREKYVGINVYSYALYLERDFIKVDLARFHGIKEKKLVKDDRVYDAILDGKAIKELRMRFCRKVDAEDVVSAFEDSLKPRMLEFTKAEKGTDKEKLRPLETFRALFTLDKLKSGNELRFTWHPDGTLSTVINGKRQKDIKSPALARALFDVYLGEDPISSAGRKNLIRRLPGLLDWYDKH